MKASIQLSLLLAASLSSASPLAAPAPQEMTTITLPPLTTSTTYTMIAKRTAAPDPNPTNKVVFNGSTVPQSDVFSGIDKVESWLFNRNDGGARRAEPTRAWESVPENQQAMQVEQMAENAGKELEAQKPFADGTDGKGSREHSTPGSPANAAQKRSKHPRPRAVHSNLMWTETPPKNNGDGVGVNRQWLQIARAVKEKRSKDQPLPRMADPTVRLLDEGFPLMGTLTNIAKRDESETGAEPGPAERTLSAFKTVGWSAA